MTGEPFYTSAAWRKLRWLVLRRDHFRCVVCGCSVAERGAARVDHIHPRRTHPQLELDINNCRTLCATHDNQAHSEKAAGGGGARRERFRLGVGADGWPRQASDPMAREPRPERGGGFANP